MTRFEEVTERLQRKWEAEGKQFHAPRGDHLIRYFNSGKRVRVRTTYPSGETFVRTGTVSISSGWIPCFMLMHRSNAFGSWDRLDERDEIIAVWNGRHYVEVRAES